MKQIFKTEMKRAMSGKGMVLSMLIGTVLGIAHVIREIIPAYRANLTNFYNEFPILSPHSAAETWMAGSPSNLEGFIFFLILPILASQRREAYCYPRIEKLRSKVNEWIIAC